MSYVWQEYNQLFKMRTTFFNSHVTRLISFPFYLILHNFDIHPNIISLLSLLSTTIGVGLFYVEQGIWGALLLQVGFGFDCLDGIFARKYGRGSKFGQFLDLFLDRISNIVIYVGLLGSLIYLHKVELTTITMFAFLIGFSLFLIFVNTAQLRGLVFSASSSESSSMSLKRFILLLPYQLLDNGMFLLLISVAVLLDIFVPFVFWYGLFQIPFIVVLVFLSYRESLRS